MALFPVTLSDLQLLQTTSFYKFYIAYYIFVVVGADREFKYDR